MNLKLYLLIRMTLMGTLCWFAVSFYLIGQSGRRAAQDITTVANQLQPMVAADVMRRWASLDSDARRPDLGGAAARFPEPMCLRYRALDGSESAWGCSPSAIGDGIPRWIARLLITLGPGHVSLQREIDAYGLRVGSLQVESDDASLLQHQWRSVRELLGLAAVMLLTLDLLAFWVLGRALRPTTQIVAALEQLGEAVNEVWLPALRPREFTLIARGINRLTKRLADSYAARAQLTARLIRIQDDERRELAHELHEEFGQCVTALSAVATSLRHSVSVGDALTEADMMPLETGIERMLSSLRAMLQRMSLPPLQQQGLQSALADLVAAWQVRLQGRPQVTLDAELHAAQIPNDEHALCICRVVQECLSNIARHAPTCQEVHVSIRQENRSIQASVSNDLLAVPQERAASSMGMGLKLLSERVRALHGVLAVEISAQRFCVRVNLPVNAGE